MECLLCSLYINLVTERIQTIAGEMILQYASKINMMLTNLINDNQTQRADPSGFNQGVHQAMPFLNSGDI